MKEITVVAAVIMHDNEFLCVQRGFNKLDYISEKYEFPGGKLEVGETEQEALIREIDEELKMEITIKGKLITVNHSYPDFQLTMHSYLCSVNSRELTLTEHLGYKWIRKDELLDLDWASADIPIVHKINASK